METRNRKYEPDLSKNLIVKMTFEFALHVMKYSELLESAKKFTISRQVIRSGTSIGANVREAQNAESRADFIHKMKIAAKEGDETEYWLLLSKQLKELSAPEILFSKLSSINKILNRIITTSKSK